MSEYVGGIAEEAAKLVEAVEAWARGALGPAHDPTDDSADDPTDDGAGDRAEPAEHRQHGWATGAPECALCPICRLIAAARSIRPETVAHLLDAMASLAAAARTSVDAAGTSRPGSHRPPVTKIEVS